MIVDFHSGGDLPFRVVRTPPRLLLYKTVTLIANIISVRLAFSYNKPTSQTHTPTKPVA